MDIESNYEQLKAILEGTKKVRGNRREARASYKKYTEEYKKLKVC